MVAVDTFSDNLGKNSKKQKTKNKQTKQN